MRRSFSLALAIFSLFWCSLAQGTSDTGVHASLLAVGGPQQRFAIVAQAEVQGGCPGTGCEIYALDLSSPSLRLLHRAPLAGSSRLSGAVRPSTLLQAYLAALPAATRLQLTPVVDPSSLAKLPVDFKRSTATEIRFSLSDQGALVASLPIRRRFRSMSAYSRGSFEGACHDWKNRASFCSSCQTVTRTVAGRAIGSFTCSGPGQFRDMDGVAQPCDCSAAGRVRQLRVVHSKTGAQVLGNEILVEPWRLAQNAMGGGAGTALDFGWAGEVGTESFTPDLSAFVTASGVVIVGSAAHARLANGTYFPVVATFPSQRLPPSQRSVPKRPPPGTP